MAARRVTTTEGRQRLPDLIQQVYGEKCVIVFHRYGRDLAALVPLEMLPSSPVDLDLRPSPKAMDEIDRMLREPGGDISGFLVGEITPAAKAVRDVITQHWADNSPLDYEAIARAARNTSEG